MIPNMSDAWQLVSAEDDAQCSAAADIAMSIAHDCQRLPSDRADAMFLLGQVERFFQPWRSSDGGRSWFNSALSIWPSHLDSLLALCEIAVQSQPVDMITFDALLSRVESLRSFMTPDHERQLDDVRRLAGR